MNYGYTYIYYVYSCSKKEICQYSDILRTDFSKELKFVNSKIFCKARLSSQKASNIALKNWWQEKLFNISFGKSMGRLLAVWNKFQSDMRTLHRRANNN